MGDAQDILPVNCGGPTVCDTCDFEIRWYKDYAEAKRLKKSTHIFPGELDGLNSQILRKISAKLRARSSSYPSIMMNKTKRQVAATIHALADAMDSVAKDLEP